MTEQWGREWKVSMRLTVPGKPVGYYAQGARPNWKRRNAYVEYKKRVQAELVAQLGLDRLNATKDRPLLIHTVAYFRNGVHPDPENVRKGVADALFYGPAGKRGSADKHTGGSFAPPLYDKDNPRVEITVEVLA